MRLHIYKDPWVTAYMADGSRAQMSIRDCIEQAVNIKKIEVESVRTHMDNIAPFVMILILIERAYKPSSYDKLEMFNSGSFDVQKVDDYIESCERVGISFDVFDAEKPFLQADRLMINESWKKKPVGDMDPAALSGNNTAFFHGRMKVDGTCIEKVYDLSKEAFAASLIRNCIFGAATGGYTSTGLVKGEPPLFVIINGTNLFETVVFSLPYYTSDELAKKDVPLWERDGLEIDGPAIINNGGFGPVTALLQPTSAYRYGTINDGRIKNIYRIPLYKDEYSPQKPSEQYGTSIRCATNLLVTASKKKADAGLFALTYNENSEVWMDVMSVDEDFFGGQGLEASRFIRDAEDNGLINNSQKFSVTIYGLCIPTSSAPKSMQFKSDDLILPAGIFNDKNRYCDLKTLLRDIRICGNILESHLAVLDKRVSGASNATVADLGNEDYKDSFGKAKRRFYEKEKDRLFMSGWIDKIAEHGLTDEQKTEIVDAITRDAELIYDKEPVNKRNFIEKTRCRNAMSYKIAKQLNKEG